MSYKTVILEKEDGIAVLTLNRPETLNAWNAEMQTEGVAALEEVDGDDAVKVLIITGAGKGFSSGADVRQELSLTGKTPWMETVTGRIVSGKPTVVAVMLKIANLGKPVMAAVNGEAAGAGFALALACDMRIASEEARFNMSFLRRGLIPDCGATYFLPRLVGLGHASIVVFSGDTIDAKEAERIGIADRVVPHTDLMKATKDLATKMAKNPPIAVRLAKKALHQGLIEPDLASHLNYEIYANSVLMNTEDFKEGVNSFLEKREPTFKGK